MPKYYIGYKMVSRDTGQYYGSSKLLNEDIANIGVKNFLKIKLKTFDNDYQARKYEQQLLEHFNARQNELFYNQTNGDKDFVAKPQHGRVCLRGKDRTDSQKNGDKNKYKIRSQKRLLADQKHSQRMKQKACDGELNYLYEGRSRWRHTPEGKVRWEKIKQELASKRSGKTKETDIGRLQTSIKLKGNENAKHGAVKLAYMDDSQFKNYLLTITQHPNIQKQMITRRQKGIVYLNTGVWLKYERV